MRYEGAKTTMKIGKVPENVLKRSVFGQIHMKRPEVVLGAGVGEDCAAVKLAPDETLVMSTDPITGTAKDIGAASGVCGGAGASSYDGAGGGGM